MIASFSDTLILVLPFVLGALLFSWKRGVLPITFLTLLAFYPFLTFKDYLKPSKQACLMEDCLTVIAVNLRHYPEALLGLAQTNTSDPDILIITELPYGISKNELLALFPMGGLAQTPIITEPHQQMGSRLAIISQKPLTGMTLQLEHFPKAQLRKRGIIRFDHEITPGKSLSFVVVHAPPPKSRIEMSSRDKYLHEASAHLANKSNFIMIGDFNMTSWEPSFSALPGKRAGNPRWSRTWNARKFWQNITIDHALLGEDIGVAEFEVLPDVGSDHFPIRLVIYPK